MQALALGAPVEAAMDERELIDMSGPAYRLAARILHSHQGAEDAVQQAFLLATRQLRSGSPPSELRPWFLKVVANAAREQARSEAHRRAREALTMRERVAGSPGAAPEMIVALKDAVAALDDELRLPVALCYEEGLSQRETALVLEVDESTVSRRLQAALDALRASLVRGGYAAAPAAILGGLKLTAPAVPAGLTAALQQLAAGGLATKGTGIAAASAAAKGGIAMKVIAGVIAAGVLAGGTALFVGPSTPHHPPSTGLASPPAGTPAPANPYNGMQTREEVFEFAEKPKVAKDGDNWVITFASKGKCDATVNIVDKDGKVIRHLASGVLGANAPYPFQQGSLSQKVVWDGLTDTFKKADAAGCKVKVGLGLKAEFERNLAFDHYDTWQARVLSGTTADGNTCMTTSWEFGAFVRLYGKDGKYLRTVFPPPADKIEAFMGGRGYGFATTEWGDKSLVGDWFGPFIGAAGDTREKPLQVQLADAVAAMKEAGVNDIKELKVSERPAGLQAEKYPRPNDNRAGNVPNNIYMKLPRIYAGPGGERVYTGGGCFDGKTGEWLAGVSGSSMESAVGWDGLFYLRTGGHGPGAIVRLDENGKAVPFSKGIQFTPAAHGNWEWGFAGALLVKNPGLKGLAHGGMGQSQTWQCGLDVAPNGDIVVNASGNVATDLQEMAKASAAAFVDGRVYKPTNKGVNITVYNSDGEVLSRQAVEGPHYGGSTHMDRDGNIYLGQGSVFPAGRKGLDGIKEMPKSGHIHRLWGCGNGSVIKFRGQGGKYPIGKMYGKSNMPAAAGAPGSDALKLEGYRTAADGGLWAYPVNNQPPNDCGCSHVRWDLDGWSRLWIPAVQLYSVMVVDSNGNRIMRIGRYGNIDDADPKYGKIHFAWVRATAASDTALYAVDSGNRRILKAALSYAAEETVPLP